MPTFERRVQLPNGQTRTVKLESKDPDDLKPETTLEELSPADEADVEEHTRGGKVDVADDHRPMEVYDDASQPTDVEE